MWEYQLTRNDRECVDMVRMERGVLGHSLPTSIQQCICPSLGLSRKRLIVEVGAIVLGNVLSAALKVVRDDLHPCIGGS